MNNIAIDYKKNIYDKKVQFNKDMLKCLKD